MWIRPVQKHHPLALAVLTKNFAGNVPTWKIWDIKSTQAKKIHFAIGEMIAIDPQPFLFVEDLGFKRWMKILQT